jgi:hypothetical protein
MTESKARPAAAGGRVSWARGRGRATMKLLGARRGDGLLVYADLAIPAAYVIDVYAQGDTHSASGSLEGDFSPLIADEAPDEPRMFGARLRLDDGRELAIELVDVEPTNADFDVREDRVGADLLHS